MSGRPTPARLKRLLRERFGIVALRPGQQEVIDAVLEGRDTLAVMPTGAGKSLCYQLPALVLPGATIVVSPLIALMQDQAEKLDEAGMEAAQVNSARKAGEEREALQSIAEASAEIIMTTPERLVQPEFLATLQRQRIDFLVVDEAHCISQWGHDFRPAFLEIGAAARALGDPPILALTATATPSVVEDIGRALNRRFHVVNTGVYRGNLRYAVRHVTNADEKLAAMRTMLDEARGPGIVYTATVRAAQDVHAKLLAEGRDAGLYHGRLSAAARRSAQAEFMAGKRPVMIATNAFGLGIDKSDLRFVVHYQIPATLEAYYQESGRAGRDGEDAQCLLLYDVADRRVQQFFLGGRYPDVADVQAVYDLLRAAGMSARLHPDEVRAALPHTPSPKVLVALKLLKEGGLIAQRPSLRYQLATGDASPTIIEALAARYAERGDVDRAKLERMIFYAQSTFCRWRMLLEYFDVPADFERCGTCDNCIRPPVIERPPQARRERRRLPENASSAFAEGASVRVPRYGEGRVVRASADETEIVFPDGATRRFVSRYVEPLQQAGDAQKT